MTSRREFLKSAGAAAGSMALLSAVPFSLASCNSSSLSYGFQTWTLRDRLGEDLAGTLKMMADNGYKEVEFCSPLGYKGTPFEQFNSMSGTELRKIIEDAGLICREFALQHGRAKGTPRQPH